MYGVKVVFNKHNPYENCFSGAEYTFMVNPDEVVVRAGDYVVVETRYGLSLAKVVGCADLHEHASYMRVLAHVDLSRYLKERKRKALEKELKEKKEVLDCARTQEAKATAAVRHYESVVEQLSNEILSLGD